EAREPPGTQRPARQTRAIQATAAQTLTAQTPAAQAPPAQAPATPRRAAQDLRIVLRPLALPLDWSRQWLSADVHVHMNYGVTYRNTPERLRRAADAHEIARRGHVRSYQRREH